MATFNPDLGDGPSAFNPVGPATPATEAIGQGLSDLAGIADTFLSATAGGNKTEAALEREAKAEVAAEMQKARGLNDAGQTDRARHVYNQALLNFQKKGFGVDDDVRNMSVHIYGSDIPINKDPSVSLNNEIQENPDKYMGAFAAVTAEDPDINPQSPEYMARVQQKVLTQQAAEFTIQRAKTEGELFWRAEGGNAYIEGARHFLNQGTGKLKLMRESGRELTPDALLEFANDWNTWKAAHHKPLNVPQEAWEPVGAMIEGVDNYINNLLSLDEQKTKLIQSDVNLKFTEAIVEAAKNGEIAEGVAAALISPKAGLLEALVQTKDFTSLLNLRSIDIWTEDNNLGGLDGSSTEELFPTEADDQIKELSSGQLRDDTNSHARLFVEMPIVEGMDLSFLEMEGTLAFNNIVKSNKSFELNTLKGIFSPKFFEKMNKIKAVDPDMYSRLSKRASLALGKEAANAQIRMSSRMRNNVFEVTPEGDVSFSLTKFREQRGQDSTNKLTKMVNEHYGGDYDAAVKDRGDKIAPGRLSNLNNHLLALRNDNNTLKWLNSTVKRFGSDLNLGASTNLDDIDGDFVNTASEQQQEVIVINAEDWLD